MFDLDLFISRWPDDITAICHNSAIRCYIRLFYDAGIAKDLLGPISFIESQVGIEPFDNYDESLLLNNTRNKLVAYAISSLAAMKHQHINDDCKQIVCFLKISVFISLFSDGVRINSSSTIMEAARDIRRLIANPPKELFEVPKEFGLLESIEYIVNIDFKRNKLKGSFLKEVKRGWYIFVQLKSRPPVKIILPRKKQHHKPQVHTQPLPFFGSELTIDDPEETQIIELDDNSVFPIRSAQRDLFRNQIIETREQLGLLLSPVRLSLLEIYGVQLWLRSTSSSISSVLVSLAMLTTLKEHEILGLNVTSSTAEVESIMSDKAAYGVIDLEANVYWRKELDVQNCFTPTEEHLPWLNEHNEWLALPIPLIFNQIMSGVVLDSPQCTVKTWLNLSDEKQAKEFLNSACREIRELGQSHRPISRRALRYSLFARIADQFGQHIASLIFANNSFSNSTRHYYMAASAEHLQLLYAQAISLFTPVETSNVKAIGQTGTVGSRLSISADSFKERLVYNINVLNELLLTVKSEKDPEQLKHIYNLVASYTVTMFACATSHRRHNSVFIEHSCWNHDYTQVLIADKIFFGESAARVIAVPEVMTAQIKNTKGWIEQIIKRLIVIGHPFYKILSASLSRKGNSPFLGCWTDSNTLKTAETSQISLFLGSDWTLPQNALRQLSYQTMLLQAQSSGYLDHQMGHVSSALNYFQNTSLRSLHDDEQNQHREIIQDVLGILGFVNLRRTKFSNDKNLNIASFLPETINGNNSETTKESANNALVSIMAEIKDSNDSIYELINKKLSHQPFIHEEALKQLEMLIVDDNGEQLDDEAFENLLKGVYLKSPKIETVFPYRMHIAEDVYSIFFPQFIELVRSIFSDRRPQNEDDLKTALLLSIIFDGQDSIIKFFRSSAEKILKIENITYVDHYLTGEILKQPVIFAGVTSTLLILLLNNSNSNKVQFNIQELDRRLEVLKESNVKNNLNSVTKSLLDFTSAAVCEFKTETWSVSDFFKHISISPRQYESGVLFGLRQKKVKTKDLSAHALERLISPTQYFPLNNTQELSAVQEQVIEKRTYKATKDKVFYKAFFKDLLQALDDCNNNSKRGILVFWNRLISDGKESRTSVTELVNSSNSLPEIIVLILTWLLEAACRKGKRNTWLAVSTIKTYLSTIGPALCELCANKSLLSLDYDDLIDVYQAVIDMGEETHAKTRSNRLMDFHKQCRKYFQFPKIDWQDLDVPLTDEEITRNIITHVEYERAICLLENDPYFTPSAREACIVALVISYRLMARRGEIRRLRVNDWCAHSGLCSIRSNVFGSTKTVKGNRRIPYKILMTEAEHDRIQAFVEEAKRQGDNPPLFYDSLFPRRIRSMDKTFNRVTEALQLATGDKNTRLYDCRHAGINFVATALQLSDNQADPIALSIKRWLPCGSFAEFQESFFQVTIGNPSTRHALLPALAQMVGHSSATTTTNNYIHLTGYWRWLSVEQTFRSLKTLDSDLYALVQTSKEQLFRQKNKTGLSASYCVIEDLIKSSAVSNLINNSGIDFPELELSNVMIDTVTAQLEMIKDIERSLRVLENLTFSSKNLKIDLHSEQAQYVIEKADLETSFVNHVWSAFQDTLQRDVGYRAFSIPAREENILLPKPYRPKAAKAYLLNQSFWSLLAKLLSLDKGEQHQLLLLWGNAWDGNSRVCKVPINEKVQWEEISNKLSWSPIFSSETLRRRQNLGVIVECCELRYLAKKDEEEITLVVLSHALFLLSLLKKVVNQHG
ncbi:hypothetical protein J9B83_13380 [Marinomonas sp. A79]|uniref:Phage integrase family protein n=1 Tax=Marinomonas vulgaris TaxID=2823372 RepID=A0ABS5HE54_9GAMM|nr:hypothetical protein [Marinomonas vulgaris]MBR7889913.1 hypothetical protein [Marinomonas vulgaris]